MHPWSSVVNVISDSITCKYMNDTKINQLNIPSVQFSPSSPFAQTKIKNQLASLCWWTKRIWTAVLGRYKHIYRIYRSGTQLLRFFQLIHPHRLTHLFINLFQDGRTNPPTHTCANVCMHLYIHTFLYSSSSFPSTGKKVRTCGFLHQTTREEKKFKYLLFSFDFLFLCT